MLEAKKLNKLTDAFFMKETDLFLSNDGVIVGCPIERSNLITHRFPRKGLRDGLGRAFAK